MRRTPLILSLGRQRQEGFWEVEASLVYLESSRTARIAYVDLVSEIERREELLSG